MSSKLTFAGYYFCAEKNALIGPDQTVQPLRRQSLEVFCLLAAKQGQVVSKEDIQAKVWEGVHVTDGSLAQCIRDIRLALGDEDRLILQTLPRRGYLLVADKAESTEVAPRQQALAEETSRSWRLGHWRQGRLTGLALTSLAFIAMSIIYYSSDRKSNVVTSIQDRNFDTSNIYIETGQAAKQSDWLMNQFLPEFRVAISRYQSSRLVDNSDRSNYNVRLTTSGDAEASQRVIAEVFHRDSAQTVFSESYATAKGTETSTHNTAVRIAAAVASPGVGAIGRHLLQNSRLTPTEELTNAECYAHGYGCSKCSGEEDNITKRAEACLVRLLEKDPDDARAWALQATIKSHQYWWGNTLPEPKRSNLALRQHLPAEALKAANRADALLPEGEFAVLWGMAEANYASCEGDKLLSLADRTLELFPADPNLLASFGSWLSYTGQWNEGTMPYLGRLEDANRAVNRLQDLYPGFTIEKALETYKILCFSDNFLDKVMQALQMTELPSRGTAEDYSSIELPRPSITNVNGLDVEYMDVGSGEPIVFVHGAISDYRSGGNYLAPISERFRYISFSRRYYGTQPWLDYGEKWSMDVFAEDLVGFIEALGL